MVQRTKATSPSDPNMAAQQMVMVVLAMIVVTQKNAFVKNIAAGTNADSLDIQQIAWKTFEVDGFGIQYKTFGWHKLERVR